MFVFPGNTARHSSAAGEHGAHQALTACSTYQQVTHRGLLPDAGKADTKGLQRDTVKPCSYDGNKTPRLAELLPAAVEGGTERFQARGEA